MNNQFACQQNLKSFGRPHHVQFEQVHANARMHRVKLAPTNTHFLSERRRESEKNCRYPRRVDVIGE